MREPTTKGRFRVSRAASDADHPAESGFGTGDSVLIGGVGIPAGGMGATVTATVAQLVAQNQQVLARLTELEQSLRTYVAVGGSRIDSRDMVRSGNDKERETKVRKDEVEQRLLVSDMDKPFRRMFVLVDSLRLELDNAREKRIEYESMMKVLKQKNTSLTSKLEAEQAELARLRKENDRLRTKNDQHQKTARVRALTTDLSTAPASNLALAAIGTATARPSPEAIAPPLPLAPTTAVATPSVVLNSAARTLPGAVGRVPPVLGVGSAHGAPTTLTQQPSTGSAPQHYASSTQQPSTKTAVVPNAPAPARPGQSVKGRPAVVPGTPGSLAAAAPSPLPTGTAVSQTQVVSPSFVAPPQMTGQPPLRPGAQAPPNPGQTPLSQSGLTAPPPQTHPPQFPHLQRVPPPSVPNPFPATAPLPRQTHPGVPPSPAAKTQPMPHADVLGAFRVPDPPVQPSNEAFCAVRHAVEEDEFGAIAGRTAQ